MESSKLTCTIIDLLNAHLMISIRNLTSRCAADINTLTPILRQLELEGAIRIAVSKSCPSSCASCNSCTSASNAYSISEDSTVISKIFTRTEENVN